MTRRAPLSRGEVGAALGVSRETLERLDIYVTLLQRWNPRINLVGAATLSDIWRRHILDSGQLLRHLPTNTQRLVDIGSGAGLPGLILAILGVPEVHLVESDQRKAAFLREAARLTSTAVTLHPQRAEAVTPFVADVVTARALAPLPKLLPLVARFAGKHTVALLLKGRELAEELTAARRGWIMRTQVLGSLSDDQGHILMVEELQHAPNRVGDRAGRG